VDGILNINKPEGMTSFGVVAIVRKLSGVKRVGHAGTLDPAASGVLPVGIGQGTRVIEFLVNTTKTYRAEIELGIATDTYDASGRVTQQKAPAGISREQFESALNSFRGAIQQIPPMYSAVKYHGQPLYKLARSGIAVERKSRRAEVYRLEITDWQLPVATVEVECSKGTYIRSIAHDLGQLLGCGAHLKSLVRIRCGTFNIGDAISMSQIEDAFRHGYWQHFVYPLDSVLLNWGAIVVGSAVETALKNGSSVVLGNDSGGQGRRLEVQPPAENYYRAYTSDGRLLGVLRFNVETGRWQPEKVFL